MSRTLLAIAAASAVAKHSTSVAAPLNQISGRHWLLPYAADADLNYFLLLNRLCHRRVIMRMISARDLADARPGLIFPRNCSHSA